MFVACVVIGLNATMLNAALPKAVSSLHATALQGSWMVLAYMVVNGSTQVVAGQIADRYDLRGVFLAGLATFAVSSVLLAVATSPVVFIVERGIQGFGASMIVTTAAAMLATVFRGRHLIRAMGFYLAGFSVAQAAGPSVGGVIASVSTWRLMFTLSCVIAFAALVAGWEVLKSVPARSTDESDARMRIDWTGNALLLVVIASLLYGISRAQDSGWGSAQFLVPVAVSLVLAPVFVAVERRVSDPAIEIDLLRDRAFTSANYAGGALIWPRLVTVILFSLYFQGVEGDGPAKAALKVTALPVGVALGSVAAGVFGRFDERRTALLYSLVTLVGVGWLLGCLAWGAPLVAIVVGFVVVGLSTGAFAAVNSTTIMRQAPIEQAGKVNGIRTTFQTGGSAAGASLMLTLVLGGLSASQADLFLAGRHDRLTAHTLDALGSHYLLAFVVMALVTLSAVVASVVLLRESRGAERPLP